MRTFTPSGMALRPVPTAIALLFTVTLAACGGSGSNADDATSPPPGAEAPTANKPIVCKDYDHNEVLIQPKTITIRNNSEGQIYPVLATSTNAANEWVQGCLRTTDPLPTESVYKLYVNDGQGIPPNSEVTITLPLYSELGPKQYATWWNGGRVLLADRTQRLRNDEDKAMATPGGVDCKGEGTACNLSTYSSKVQFPEDAFAQLSEYTFGDAYIPSGQSVRLLKPENVGYNISYVDHVYMPVAIGVRGNPYIGYSGSAQKLGDFRTILRSFLNGLGAGWPVYNMSELRLPGGYNIFAQRGGYLIKDPDVPVQPPDNLNPPVLTVMQCIDKQCTPQEQRNMQWGQSVQNIQDLWGACVDWGSEAISAYTSKKYPQDCPAPDAMKANMVLIKDFFTENHKKYLALYASGACQGSTPPEHVAEFKYWEAIKHIYGWVPYNEGCGAAANKLSTTTAHGRDHAYIQSMYIQDLHYNYKQPAVQANAKLTFNPYVKLIHDDLGMSAYGFSVDDAVGFMSELGNGLVFTVGGEQGLENGLAFNYADGFEVLLGGPSEVPENKPLLKKYGVCSMGQEAGDLNCEKDKQDVAMPDGRKIVGFRVGTMPSYPMKVRFTDAQDNVYTLLIKEKFAACTGALANCPSNKAAIVDKSACSVITPQGQKHANSERWCNGANPNQSRENDEAAIKNHLSYPVPVKYLP